MAACKMKMYEVEGCPGKDYHGRCLGACKECGEHLLSTGRYTTYCPSCDCCSTCGCPNADGFAHYADCTDKGDEDNSHVCGCADVHTCMVCCTTVDAHA